MACRYHTDCQWVKSSKIRYVTYLGLSITTHPRQKSLRSKIDQRRIERVTLEDALLKRRLRSSTTKDIDVSSVVK